MSSGLPALRATWAIPQSDEPILQYILWYRKDGTTIWNSQRTIKGSPPQTSTIKQLAADTEYNVIVRAVSSVGVGNWSTVQTKRTYMSEFYRAVVHLVPNNYSVVYVIIIYFVCSKFITLCYNYCVYICQRFVKFFG